MKSPSEIAMEIAEEVLIKSGLYQRAGVWPDDIDDSKCLRLVTQAITLERQRQERLMEALKWAWPYVANVNPKTDKSKQIDALIEQVLK